VNSQHITATVYSYNPAWGVPNNGYCVVSKYEVPYIGSLY